MPNNKIKKLSKIKKKDKIHPFSRKAMQMNRVLQEKPVESHSNAFFKYWLENHSEASLDIITGFFGQEKNPMEQLKIQLFLKQCITNGLVIPTNTAENVEFLERGKYHLVKTETLVIASESNNLVIKA